MIDLRKVNFPKLKEEDNDRDAIRRAYLRQNGKITVNNLKKNGFEACYCDTLEEARDKVFGLIKDGSVIGCGDSHTMFAMHMDKDLENKGCVVIPHTCAVNGNAYDKKMPGYKILGNRQETREILMNYLVADVFMLGANAITLDGQIINIDGTGNRVAGSIYGSDRIIVIAGANKIVKDLNAGLDRIRFTAAQMNNIKYHNELACNLAGKCVDCRMPGRNCNITSIIHRKPEEADFHVVIIGEDMGF